MNSVAQKRLQAGSGKQFFDSGDYNMNRGQPRKHPMAGGAFPPAFQKKPLPKNITESGHIINESNSTEIYKHRKFYNNIGRRYLVHLFADRYSKNRRKVAIRCKK